MKTSYVLFLGLALTASSAMANNLNVKLDPGVDITQLAQHAKPDDQATVELTAWNNRGDKIGSFCPGLLGHLTNEIVNQRQITNLGSMINMPFRHATDFHFRFAIVDDSRTAAPTLFVCDKQLQGPFDDATNYVLDIHSLKPNDCDIVEQK